MPSDSPRQRARPIAAADDEDARDTRTSIIVGVTLASTIGAIAASHALALSSENRHALGVVAPALLVGAAEGWMDRGSARAAGGGDTHGRHWLASVGRGALLGAAIGVLSDALGERGFPALVGVLAPVIRRLFAALDVPLNTSTEGVLGYW
jgi:hypothetical protein